MTHQPNRTAQDVGTADRDQRAKQPLNAAIAGPYGHPFHPILVTIPIGAWVTSIVFDIGSHIVDHPGFLTQGSQWLIAIGVIGALLAACVGFTDFLQIPSGTVARRTALVHMTLNLTVTVAYIANFFWRQNGSDATAVGGGQIALSVVSLIALGASGYLGGKLAYRYGVRVAADTDQADGFVHQD